jgi:hypothetical protein
MRRDDLYVGEFPEREATNGFVRQDLFFPLRFLSQSKIASSATSYAGLSSSKAARLSSLIVSGIMYMRS